MASSGLNTKLITDKSRSRCEIRSKLTINTLKKNRNSKNMAVNKDMFIVHQKSLEQSVRHAASVNKEAQSLLLAFSVSAAEFE